MFFKTKLDLCYNVYTFIFTHNFVSRPLMHFLYFRLIDHTHLYMFVIAQFSSDVSVFDILRKVCSRNNQGGRNPSAPKDARSDTRTNQLSKQQSDL